MTKKVKPVRFESLPDIEDFLRRLLTKVNQILDPEYDQRAVRLGRVIRYRKYLSDVTREDAAKTLRQVSNRCFDYANELWLQDQAVGTTSGRRLLTDRRHRMGDL